MTAIYDAERRDISIALGGDAMITRRMQAFQEPRFLKLVEILRGADVSLVNLEMLFHDYESSWQWSSATYTRSDPKNLDELKWMGINAVTTANNHSFDFSEGGFLTTLEHCREIDLAYAGGGRNLDEARSPAYVDSARGRVAVMGATSTFSEQSRAGAGRPDFAGPARGQRPASRHHPPRAAGRVRRPAQGQPGIGLRGGARLLPPFRVPGQRGRAGPEHRNRLPGSQVYPGRGIRHSHRLERGRPAGYRQLDSRNAEAVGLAGLMASTATRAAPTATSTAIPACLRPTS